MASLKNEIPTTTIMTSQQLDMRVAFNEQMTPMCDNHSVIINTALSLLIQKGLDVDKARKLLEIKMLEFLGCTACAVTKQKKKS